MRQLNEFLKTSGVTLKDAFPDQPIQDDVIDFLEKHGFNEMNVKSPGLEIETSAQYFKQLFRDIEREAKYKSYCLIINEANTFNDIYLFNGGSISRSNPCFCITVFESKQKIDEIFNMGEIYYDKKNKDSYNLSQYGDFIEEIRKNFDW